MKIEAALTYDKIRHDQDHNAHLVISLTAPAKAGEERAPICVVPVIDISGSMNGPKLEYAKRSAYKLIDHLRVGDYCGVIAFESRVHVTAAPQKITSSADKERLKAEVGKLTTIGGTNFAGGMLKAIELVNNLDLPEGVLHRIIMLTDGQANEGPATKKEDLIRLFTANAGRVTASAFGYGNDVSQDLLGDFARECKGNYAFIRDPDGALTAFGKELGGLTSTYATDLMLELNPLAGHEIVSVVSDCDADEEAVGGEITIKLPEILAEERRDLVLSVKLKAQKQAFPRAVNVFDAKLAFDTISPDGKKEKQSGEAKAKAQFVKPGEENPKADPSLDKIVALAEVVRAQIEAEEKVKVGDWHGAAAVMHNAAAEVKTRGHVVLAAAACKTAGSVSSNAAYSSDQGYLQSFRNAGTRAYGTSEIDEGAASFLSDAGVSLSNSSQTATSNAFAGGATVLPIDPGVIGAGTSLGVVQQGGGFDLGSVLAGTSAVGHLVQGGSVVLNQPLAGAPVAGSILVAPPVPQTNSPAKDEAREKAIEKLVAKAGKIKKTKSSARW